MKAEGHNLDTQTLNLLRQTSQFFSAHNRQAYLTGGSLRNLLLGEPCSDWDIVTDGNVPQLARSLADKLAGYYVHLNDKASRIVIKHAGSETTIDIAPLKGNTIEEDLRQRDFTINAIAVPLAEIIHLLQIGKVVPFIDDRGELIDPHSHETTPGRGQAPPLLYSGFAPRNLMPIGEVFIDPLNGLADIQARQLKAVDDTIFKHDPLRMLRAIRLSMRYQLSIEPGTENLVKRDAKLLPLAAPERIHDELYAILEPDGATSQLRHLDTLGLLTVLIPEFILARGMRQPSPHYWDVLEHSLESVGALERLAGMIQRGGSHDVYSDDFAELRALLLEAEQRGIFQFASLTAPRMKLAALLHDIGKPITYSTGADGNIHFYDHPQAGIPLAQQIMTRLNARTQDRRVVQLVVAHHMRPGQLGNLDTVTPRAIRRYFVDLGPMGIHVALFSLADHIATVGPLWDEYTKRPDSSWPRHLSLVRLLLIRYIRERESILPARLVSPEELMRRLKLEPGPLIGHLLESIAEAQAEGRIHSKEEALWLAEEEIQGRN